jgi:putative ABC transport system permease protein
VAWGTAVGLAGAFVGAKLLRSWLFGVGSADPVTIGAVIGLLSIVALIACLMPTFRAIRLDPAEVMKAE